MYTRTRKGISYYTVCYLVNSNNHPTECTCFLNEMQFVFISLSLYLLTFQRWMNNLSVTNINNELHLNLAHS